MLDHTAGIGESRRNDIAAVGDRRRTEDDDKFGAEISDEAAQKIVTVGDAVSYIDSHK